MKAPYSILIWTTASLGLTLPALGQPTNGAAHSDGAAALSAAIHALRVGQFDKAGDLLSADPALARAAGWARAFETQRQAFAAQRREQFDRAVDNVNKLARAHRDAYAIDDLGVAYLLAEDKAAFRKLSWVDPILRKAAEHATECEAKEQWLACVRIYSTLASLEPAHSEWKTKLKLATRRARLVSFYAPERLKGLQESESKEREAIDAILHPAAPAKDKPKANDETANHFAIDWKESLRGITMPMLRSALIDARSDYYRDVPAATMLTGGLNALSALATTAGLEKPFPALADPAKKQAFLQRLKGLTADARTLVLKDEGNEIRRILVDVEAANRESIKLPEDVLVYEFTDGAMGELDPFTSVIWPGDLREFAAAGAQGTTGGIGVQIRSEDDGSLIVVSPLEESPAYRASVKPGDVILAIDGWNAQGITTAQAVKALIGPIGSTLTLQVRHPDGSTALHTIQRETVKTTSVKGYHQLPGGGWDYLVDPEQKIAYVRITNFTKSTGDELKAALDDLKAQGARALILDVRYNPGGLLTSATDVCEKFVNKGVIVSTRADRETRNPPTVARANGTQAIDLPLVVLVNPSASGASEIVSGFLQEQHRALIVGQRTFGSGSVQMLFPLAQRTAYLKLTTSRHYLPNGHCVQREESSPTWGVDPDVAIEMTAEQMRQALGARQAFEALQGPAGQAVESKPNAQARPHNAPLESDLQLSGGLFLLRLQLAGGHIR